MMRKIILFIITLFFIFPVVPSTLFAELTIDIPDTPIICGIDESLTITLTGTDFGEDTRVLLIPKKESAIIGSIDTHGTAVDVAIKDDIAFVGNANFGGDLRIIDISEPSNLIEISMIRIFSFASGISIPEPDNDNKIYVSGYSGGLHTIDINNPKYPLILSNDEYEFGIAIRAKVISNLAYIAAFEGLKIIDISKPKDYQLISYYPTEGMALNVSISNDIAFISLRNKCIDIVNINDPAKPYHIAKINEPAIGTIIKNNTLYFVNQEYGLFIYNIEDISDPIQIGFFETSGKAFDIEVVDNIAYIADFEGGIKVIDIEDPYNPNQIWSLQTPDTAWRIKIRDNMAFTACDISGLMVIAIPVELKTSSKNNNKLSITIPQQSQSGEYTLQIFNKSISYEISVIYSDWKPLQINPKTYQYEKIEVESISSPYTFVVSNISDNSITIGSLTLSDNDSFAYTIVKEMDGCSNIHLSPNTNCQVKIIFKPSVEGTFYSDLIVPYYHPISQQLKDEKASLAGKGYRKNSYKFEKLWPTAKQDWNFYSPTGITVDNDGYVYVADMKNHRIVKLSSEGRLINKWGGFGTGDGQFNLPTDIHFDGLRSVYVVDDANHRIQRFSLNGKFEFKFGKRGISDGEFFLPFNMAIDSKGNIYVTDRANNRIQKFSNQGIFISKWGSYGENYGEFKEPIGIAISRIDNNEFVYVIDYYRRVQKFTDTGEFIFELDLGTEPEAQLNYVSDLTVDNVGNIYVLDGKIRIFDQNGELIERWEDYGVKPGQASMPTDMVFDNKNNCYITDWHNESIYKYNKEKQFLARWDNTGAINGEFNDPYFLKYNKGKIYVFDLKNYRVQIFNENGEYINNLTVVNDLDFHYTSLRGIDYDKNGYVYVLEQTSKFPKGYICKFDLKDQFIDFLDFNYNDQTLFVGIAVSKINSVLYTCDILNNRIYKFDSENGNLLKSWGTFGNEDGQFNVPSGIAIDSNDFVYVVERKNCRVQKFDSDGNFILKWGKAGSKNGEFKFPSDITVDDSNFIYVSDDNYRIQKFTSDGKFVAIIGEPGSGPGQFRHIYGMSTSPDGVIYVTDDYNRVQSFREKVWTGGKAIIVAGGGPYKGNNIWDDTLMNANFAYQSLTMQGFTKETIYYLNHEQNIDLDDNGENDDIDGLPTNINLEYAITNWAADTDNLVLYLVDHGFTKLFQMSGMNIPSKARSISDEAGEMLTVDDLNEWLTIYEKKTNGKVILIYDACHSGSFLEPLSLSNNSGMNPQNRIIISSSKSDEPSIFAGQGSITFSSYFWTHISHGLNIGDSFNKAMNSMQFQGQHACIDSNANGQPNEYTDIAIAQSIHIGNGMKANEDAPIITGVSESQVIKNDTSATISVFGVHDSDGIVSVKAMIRPPVFDIESIDNPIKNFPSIEFKLAAGDSYSGDYVGVYDKFNISGTYDILIYATDKKLNMSPPVQTSVSFENPTRRRAIIAIGSSQWETPHAAVANNANLAYRALRFQKYSDDDIYYLSPVAYEDLIVDASPNKDNLQFAIKEWAAINTQDLVLYLVGDGDHQDFLISKDEKINGSEIDSWLNSIENMIPGLITVVYDACQAKSVTDLLVNNANNRILIASTGTCNPAYFQAVGNISFSHTFWSKIRDGKFVSDAFYDAKETIQVIRADQKPSLYDPDNKSRTYVLGFGMKLGDISPLPGTLNLNMQNSTSAEISVNAISINEIEHVWTLISEPGLEIDPTGELGIHCGVLAAHLPGVILTKDENTNKYRGVYDGFDKYGKYIINVYIKDKEGNISSPEIIEMFHDTGPDIYENDNDMYTASIIRMNDGKSQLHNFHDSNDMDYVKFYAIKDEMYSVELNATEEIDTSVLNLQLEVWQNGKRILNDYYTGRSQNLDFFCEQEGVVILRIYQPNSDSLDVSKGYELYVKNYEIKNIQNQSPAILGKVYDFCSNELISNAFIKTDASFSAISESEKNPNYYIYGHPTEKDYTIFVESSGYLPFTETIHVSKSDKTIIEIPMISTTKMLSNIINILKIISGSQDQNLYDNICFLNEMKNASIEEAMKVSIKDAIISLQILHNY